MKKEQITFIITLILSVFICKSSFADSVLGSGTCGENAEAGTKCEWKVVDLGGGKKELQISGSGPMDNYNASWDKPITSSNVPWRNYQSSITSISISGDITSIGNNAFIHAANCSLIDMTQTKNLTYIGDNPFELSGIRNVTVPATVTDIGAWFLSDMDYLQSVTFQGNIPNIGHTMFWNRTPHNVQIYYNSESEDAKNKLKTAINNYLGNNPSLIACIPHADGSKDLFDAQGKLLKRIDESGNLVQTYAYNEKGQLSAIYDANGNTLESYGYNSSGQLISIFDADGNKIESYKYDFGGNLIAVYKNGERVFAKRIYTVDEAIAATHQNKNTFSIIYR